MSEVYFNRLRTHFERHIAEVVLPGLNAPPRLHAALDYTLTNGGKRLRPLLVYLSGELFGCSLHHLNAPATAVECIHTYSLIHDDLPAMDDDDLRRGRPTCHLQFDEATAILAGDALQALAFETLTAVETGLTVSQRLAMVRTLAQNAGSMGLIGGQMLDLAATGQALDLDALTTIHQKKTGALFHTSVCLGLIAAEIAADDPRHQALLKFADALGLAFQIKDDLLDVEASTEILGKRQGADVALNKATYPSLLGLTESKAMLKTHIDQALESLASLSENTEHLQAMAHWCSIRGH